MTAVTHRLDAQFQVDFQTFRLDVDLHTDGITALVGPNGAGKTTILRTVLGLVTPDRGRVRFDGEAWFDETSRVTTPVQARRIGYVPQSYGLFPHLTVERNVRFGARWAVGDVDIPAIMSQFDVDHLAGRSVRDLSGGESQRVAIARAVASAPNLLLLDEPLAALDRVQRRHTTEVLGRFLESSGVAALIVTHDPADARRLADSVAVLEAGHVVETLSIDDVERVKSPFARAFFAE